MNPHLRWAAALAAITMLTSCSVDDGFPDEIVEGVPGSSVATPAFTGAPRLELPASAVSTVATGFRIPWGLAFLPDGTALVTERGNKVPDAPDDPGGTARIMSVTPQGVVTEVQRLPEVDLRLGEGGRLAFGPDGMLYASVGETYFGSEIAQDRNSLGGKILRMTLDGKPAPDNPVPGSLVWSYGHRNVQGLAWDAQGRMYASELGSKIYDELNLIEPGRNHGWPLVEGFSTNPELTNPIATWTPTSIASPSGIAVLGEHIYVACLRGQGLYRVDLDGRNPVKLLDTYGRLRTIAVAPDGSLWVATFNRDQVGREDRVPLNPAGDIILRVTPP